LRVGEEERRDVEAVAELEGGAIERLAEEGGPQVELISSAAAMEALEDAPIHVDGEE
jgi:hypothetical protein